MNFKKTKVAVASGLMAASMVLAPLAAYADNDVQATPANSVSVTKTVKVASGVTIDHNVDFTVTQVQNTDQVVAPNETVKGNAHTFTKVTGLTGKHTFKTKDKTDASIDGVGSITNEDGDFQYKTAETLNFVGLTTPGEYTFEIAETGEGTDEGGSPVKLEFEDGYGWTVEKDTKYVLRVYVTSASSGNKSYTLQKLTYNEEENSWTADSKKNETAAFTNTFTKKGGSDVPEEKASLKISKVVANKTYADPNQEFEFTIKFEADQNSPAQVPNNITPENRVDYSWGGGEDNNYTFKLKDGQTLSFNDLPAGIHYTVTEKKFTNKKSTSNVATANNIFVAERKSKKEEDASTGKLLVGEQLNSAKFTNEFADVNITGVVTHSAPFVIMVGALFVAVGGYVVLKKRIEEE